MRRDQRVMKKQRLIILTACMAVFHIAYGRADYRDIEVREQHVAVPDSVPEDDSYRYRNEAVKGIGVNRTDGNGIDAMKHLLERRYRAYGDTFTKKWYDHLFVEAGAGFEKMIPPGSDYNFDAITTAHLGLGKQFNRLHSVRLLVNGGFGYQHDKNVIYYKAGVSADHLFSLTSYFDGYDPSRLLELSTVWGVGAQYAKYGRNGISGKSFDAHVGLQLRFFTGPQGYINIEPYCGLATDNRDLSERRNWRKMDMFYGANINFIYYLNNNLSPESRSRFLKNRHSGNELVDDKKLQSWRQPWFFEFSNGLDFVESPTFSLGETLGHNFSIGVGKWLSSAIGLRFTATSSTATWQKKITSEVISPTYRPSYESNYRNLYVGMRGEALINPLGFSNNYSWDSHFGFYLLAGGEMGRIMKYQSGKHLACNMQAYTAGVHLWARLSDGLQMFLEPRYINYVYKVPYSNVDWNKRFTDNAYSLNMGFTVSTTGVSYRRGRALAIDTTFSCFVVGGGIGSNVTQTKSSYVSSAGIPWNGLVFGEFHLNRTHAARLSFDLISLSRASLSSFTDYRPNSAGDGYTSSRRTGLWNHRYYFGFMSFDYMVNMTNLCAGYRPGRRFEFEAYVGPTLNILFGESASLDDSERMEDGHEYRLNKRVETTAKFGLNAGLKLTAHVTPRIDAFFSPTIYAMRHLGISGINFIKLRHIETLNVGVQYNL